MSPIGILDSLSLATVLIGLIIFLLRGRSIHGDVRFLFIGVLSLTLFRNFSNVLEWTGITATVGLYEEYVEILTPLFWVFFFYAFMRHKAEKALWESEDRYKTLVESSPTCVYVRQDDRFRYVNERMIELSGYSHEELLNMPIFNLINNFRVCS